MQQFIAALQTRDLFSVFLEISARVEARSRICAATLRAAPRPGRRKNTKFQLNRTAVKGIQDGALLLAVLVTFFKAKSEVAMAGAGHYGLAAVQFDPVIKALAKGAVPLTG